MTKSSTTNKALTLLLAATLVLPFFNTSQASAAASSAPINSTYTSYFNQKYDNLVDDKNVFKTTTYHELDYLLDSEGTYVFLFGGAWSKDTQSVVGYINEVAQAKGIKAVYNFDTRLDGQDPATDIADSANNPISRRYVDLVNKYLTNLSTQIEGSESVTYSNDVTSGKAPNLVTKTLTGTAQKIQTPYLFVYNKNNKNGSANAPIISSVEGIDALLTNGVVDQAKVDAYKAKVSAAFDAVPANLKAGLQADQNNNNYIASSYNEFAGETIFGEADKDIVLDPVTYDELNGVLKSEGNYVFLFGCSWCPNTRAVAKYVNEYAKKYNITKVYNWDTKLDGGIGGTPDVPAGTDSSNFLQIRATGAPFSDRYVDLVNTYLTNIETLYAKASNNVSYKDANGVDHVANKLQVPYFFIYNKDHKDAQGKPAPILDHVELMYTWKDIQPDYELNGKKGVNYNNYIEALDRAFSELQGAADQAAPTGLTGKAPKSDTSKDGQISGTSTALEYKRAEDKAYAPVTGTSLTGLTQGTYYVRVAAKTGFKPSPSTIIDLNLEQPAAPTGLGTAAATTSLSLDGKITGTTAQLEYKLSGTTKYTAAKATETTGLSTGKYQVRYAAKYGYNPSPATDVVISYTKSAFVDVPESAWHDQAINYLAANKIAGGTDETHFSPNDKLTRGQFITLLLKAYGIAPEENAKDNFADAGNTYYTPYLAAAKRLNIAGGVGDNQFAPNQSISREELFTLLHRSLGVLNKLPKGNGTATLSSFTDADQIAGFAQEAFKSLVEGGILTGDNAKLNPQNLSTRAEAAQVLYNLLK
ncbi:S-layer homology domain-containing protein [Paenibacillus qinlingensis]|uniref:S-layer homology domain-containing protein n=1 Tax=Paenibacillus qinlingensis TaxID=1837343 RepID=UPI00156403C6|nr:S-layer homology domain-containing protein [Paenibacillus qinlingensis]NQX63979.1 S-layer homology domain-containing protein [Paenibacillus qinlingensis]